MHNITTSLNYQTDEPKWNFLMISYTITSFVLRVVFVDAGVVQSDIEIMKMKEEQKIREAQARAVAEHGELALITVGGHHQATTQEKMSLRSPMLQVKKLFSF